jgi:hypothetical protein
LDRLRPRCTFFPMRPSVPRDYSSV